MNIKFGALFLLLILIPNISAWDWSTHRYIARQVLGDECELQVDSGSIYPDQTLKLSGESGSCHSKFEEAVGKAIVENPNNFTVEVNCSEPPMTFYFDSNDLKRVVATVAIMLIFAGVCMLFAIIYFATKNED